MFAEINGNVCLYVPAELFLSQSITVIQQATENHWLQTLCTHKRQTGCKMVSPELTICKEQVERDQLLSPVLVPGGSRPGQPIQ